jgi:glycosyltransferase involved in cell wall biosynthesis
MPQGRDGYVKELDQLIAKAGLEGRVKRVGHCTDMPAALLSAAVVTVPSTEPEAFGRVAVEAQAMGAPVVVSDLGAVPETVLAPPQVTRRRSAPAGACRRAMQRRSPRAWPRRWPCGLPRAMPWHGARASMSSGISRWRRWWRDARRLLRALLGSIIVALG